MLWNSNNNTGKPFLCLVNAFVSMCAVAFCTDLFQPKTDLFFKNVRYFSQSIFSLFSYLKNVLHNLVIDFVVRYCFFKDIEQVFINFTHSLVAIELLTFCKNTKKLFYCSRELSLFWLNK